MRKSDTIDGILEYIVDENNRLKQLKERNSILYKLDHQEKLEENEKKVLIERVEKEVDDKDKVEFYKRMVENDIPLDSKQLKFLGYSLDYMQEETNSIIELTDKIIFNIKNGKHLEPNMLIYIRSLFFEKLQLNMDYEDKFRFLDALFRYNVKTGKKVETEEDRIEVEFNEAEPEKEKIVHISGKKEAPKDYPEILGLYLFEHRYSYEELSDKAKEYLINYSDRENVYKVLSTLDKYHIYIETGNPKADLLFSKILCFTSVDIIEDIKNDFELTSFEFKESAFSKFVSDYPGILLPDVVDNDGKKVISRDTGGAYTYYCINKAYFNSQNIDLGSILDSKDSSRLVMLKDPKQVRLCYEIFTKVYGIPFISGVNEKTGKFICKSLTTFGQANPYTLLSSIDKSIEAAPYMYEYIKEYPNKAIDLYCSVSDRDMFKRIKLANQKGKSFVRTTAKGATRLISSASMAKDSYLEELISADEKTIRDRFGEEILIPIVDSINSAFSSDKFMETCTKDWENDDLIKDSEYIKFFESQYRAPDNKFLYDINGTLISRMKVLRIYGQLFEYIYENRNNPEFANFDEQDIIKIAISKDSTFNKNDVHKINAVLNIIRSNIKKPIILNSTGAKKHE